MRLFLILLCVWFFGQIGILLFAYVHFRLTELRPSVRVDESEATQNERIDEGYLVRSSF